MKFILPRSDVFFLALISRYLFNNFDVQFDLILDAKSSLK